MNRDDVNLYLNRFLALGAGDARLRSKLVEAASHSASLLGFLQEWLWELDKGVDEILELKLYFGLTYSELGELFGLSFREVSQHLRTRRLNSLGSYPRADQAEVVAEQEGLSCFMVEQQLSQWVDSEWEDLAEVSGMKDHLDQCSDCKSRLIEYRKLHSKLLSEIEVHKPISEDEWIRTLRELARKRWKRGLKWVGAVVLIFALIFFFTWIIRQQPETMPNIYEIPEA